MKIKYVQFRFSVVLRGNMETLPTPPIRVAYSGDPVALVVEAVNVYQGKRGSEIYVRSIKCI